MRIDHHRLDVRSPCSLDNIRASSWSLMLPHPQHGPAEVMESGVRPSVPRHVRVQLCPPPVGVRLRSDAVVWAGVPEAAIHEDRQAGAREDYVRPARQGAHVDAKSEAPPVKLTAQSHLRPGSTGLEIRHEAAHGLTGRRRLLPTR